ncbi:MAG: response regulator [Pseudobdellovibrionaceae bacterium]
MTEKVKILCIDDNVDLGFVLKEILELDGFEVCYESSPQSALNRLENEVFAVILCDYNMPELNGEQVIQRIRLNGLITPVVFLTGCASKEFILSALRLGAADVLEKPCHHDILTKSIQRVIEIERRRSEVYAQLFENPDDPALKKKLKMLGLMQIVNQRKEAS